MCVFRQQLCDYITRTTPQEHCGHHCDGCAGEPGLHRLFRAAGAERLERSEAEPFVRNLARMLVGCETSLHFLRAKRRDDGSPEKDPGESFSRIVRADAQAPWP